VVELVELARGEENNGRLDPLDALQLGQREPE
jgi:hypothetical protein